MLKLAFVSFRPAAALLVLCNGRITAQSQNIFLADVRRHVPVSSDTFRSSFVPCTNVAREDAGRADRLGYLLGERCGFDYVFHRIDATDARR